MTAPSISVASQAQTGYFRLKAKIRTPHQALTSHLSRLQRLQVASDALRRIYRVVILSRRLETQMIDLDRVKAQPLSSMVKEADTSALRRSSSTTIRQDPTFEPEGDLERIVSQAALHIAELCTYSCLVLGRMPDRFDLCSLPSHSYVDC